MLTETEHKLNQWVQSPLFDLYFNSILLKLFQMIKYVINSINEIYTYLI